MRKLKTNICRYHGKTWKMNVDVKKKDSRCRYYEKTRKNIVDIVNAREREKDS